jgi:hypothetical protein
MKSSGQKERQIQSEKQESFLGHVSAFESTNYKSSLASSRKHRYKM